MMAVLVQELTATGQSGGRAGVPKDGVTFLITVAATWPMVVAKDELPVDLSV
jgi:hypothetical protein